MTWWAYAAYAGMIVTALVFWRRREIRAVQRREREESRLREAQLKGEIAEARAQAAETMKELEKQQTRIQIARDLHDEVGSTLSSISLFARASEEGKPKGETETARVLSMIVESASHAKEAMSDIIWSIDPTNDSWENVISKMRRFASDLLESKRIAHAIELNVPAQGFSMDPQRRRHLWLLFKEIIVNVAKHSSCTEAHIHFSMTESNITLTVRDNGVGFDPDAVHTGNGLRNIRTRGQILGADVELSSAPGAGTGWTIHLRP
jgi:signal transduction histidine kinase